MALPPLPPALKKITQYVKRAEELDKDVTHPESKIVAYYCRQYAMEQGIAMRDNANSKEIMPYLIALMDHLEKEKKTLAGHSAEEGKATVQQFADRVFNKGDEEDQLGVADKGTARTFYAAGVFYDVMQQFKDLDTAVEAKRKYCKWKAADILNAIKEGRTPAPGGFAATTNAGESGGSLGDGTAAGGGIAGDDMMASQSKIPPPAPTDIPQAPVSSPFSLPTSPPRPQQPAEDPFAPVGGTTYVNDDALIPLWPWRVKGTKGGGDVNGAPAEDSYGGTPYIARVAPPAADGPSGHYGSLPDTYSNRGSNNLDGVDADMRQPPLQPPPVYDTYGEINRGVQKGGVQRRGVWSWVKFGLMSLIASGPNPTTLTPPLPHSLPLSHTPTHTHTQPPYSSVIPGGGGAHTDGARADGPSQPSITSPKVPPPSYTSTGTSAGARLPPSATVTDAGRSSSAGKGLGQGPSRVPSNSVSAAKAAAIKDATELCYFAIAAMQHKEVDLAVERLERALATLKKP